MGPAKEHLTTIRDLDAIEEIKAVEELQKDVWGIPDIEVVPLTQLVAAKASGGVLIGAFDEERIVGFVYGFTGFERGVAVHHSHMLAVRPEYRSHDLGFRLKAEQRLRVLAQGIRVMTWTFDPLQSLNAYFNINKLGAMSDRYLVNFYGEDAASFLHRTGTDRFWVSWILESPRVAERLEGKAAPEDERPETPKLVELLAGNRPGIGDTDAFLSADSVSVEIPADISAMEELDIGLAAEWREATRVALSKAIGAGFIVKEFHRELREGQYLGTYVLTREKVLYT